MLQATKSSHEPLYLEFVNFIYKHKRTNHLCILQFSPFRIELSAFDSFTRAGVVGGGLVALFAIFGRRQSDRGRRRGGVVSDQRNL